jgi:hypothetical protein
MCHGQHKSKEYGKGDKHAKAIPYSRKTKHKKDTDKEFYS